MASTRDRSPHRPRPRSQRTRRRLPLPRQGSAGKPKARGPAFTHRQGQFLAFIHLYRRLHRRGPAELDLVQYFRVTPPAVHGMIVKREELGLVTRERGVPRSVRVTVPEEDLPPLQEVRGPPW